MYKGKLGTTQVLCVVMVDQHPPLSNYSSRPLEEVVKGLVATINAAAAIVTEIDVTRFRLGLNRSNQFLKSRNCIQVCLAYLLAFLTGSSLG
jgi:hypothetical protein